MEKDQVTIAIQASGLQGPLGQHACSAFIALDGASRVLVFLVHDLGQEREVGRFYFPAGAMTADDADIASINLGNVLYDYFLRYCGIQPELPVASG